MGHEGGVCPFPEGRVDRGVETLDIRLFYLRCWSGGCSKMFLSFSRVLGDPLLELSARSPVGCSQVDGLLEFFEPVLTARFPLFPLVVDNDERNLLPDEKGALWTLPR